MFFDEYGSQQVRLYNASGQPLLADNQALRVAPYVKGTAVGDSALLAESAAAPNLRVRLYGGASPVRVANDDMDNVSATEIGLYVRALMLGYDGGYMQRWRNNIQLTALASGARTGDTNSADLTNHNGRGLAILVDVTAIGAPAGQISNINVQAKIGSNYKTVYQFAAVNINTVSQNAFLIDPGAVSAGAWTAAPVQGRIPRTWRLQMDHANEADSITYQVDVVYLV